ncbi:MULTISPECIES: hypothetical protein [unclassified Modestobacter]
MSTPPNRSSDQGQPPRSRRKRTLAVLAGVIVLILVVIFGYMLLVGGLVD